MIQIKDVTKLYPAKEAGNGNGAGKDIGFIHALDHISLHVTQGNGCRSWGRRDRGNRRW